MNPAAEIEQAIRCIPILDGQSSKDFTISKLPGYSNHNFRLRNRHQDWVMRIPKPETSRFIDRDAEAHNQSLASALGIAPQCSWRNRSGLSLTPTIRASRSIRAADFASEQGMRIVIRPLQLLHRSRAEFQGEVDLLELLTRYFAILSKPQQQQFSARLDCARIKIAALKDRDRKVVPSHNDLVLENLLLSEDKLWMIDWEYAAMASPYWDLATLCNAAALNEAQCVKLLKNYCSADEAMEEATLFDYRELLQLLSDCWMAAFVGTNPRSC